MADQLARGIFANFAPTEAPFDGPNDMEDNLRLLDDHLAISTLAAPVAVGTTLPSLPPAGSGQIFLDGSYAVFNLGAWRQYSPLTGVCAVHAGSNTQYFCTGTGWTAVSKVEEVIGKEDYLTRLVAVVASISLLRSVDSAKFKRVQVLAYVFHGSTGGGRYECDDDDLTSLENGGTVIVGTDGARWKLLYDGASSAEMFGAIGDGSPHPLSERFGSLDAAKAVYPFATALAQQIDWAATQAAVNDGDPGPYGEHGKPVHLGGGAGNRVFIFGDELTSPDGRRITLRGPGNSQAEIRATNEFQGNLISPSGGYDLEGIKLVGNETDGCYLLGNNDVGSGGGATRLNRVNFQGADGFINFGGNYQHPLGLNYHQVGGYGFRTFGMSIGGLPGEGTGFNGESAFSLNGTAVFTNGTRDGIAYSHTVSANTPASNRDTVSWTASQIPRFGFCVLRSANGATGWHVPPNWTRADYTATSFVAWKEPGETWTYKVVRMTVGANLHRAKAIFGDVLQCEDCGVGLIANGVGNVQFASFYYENSDAYATVPRGNFAGVWGRSAGRVGIGSGWVDGAGYAVFAADNSRMTVDNITAFNCDWAAIGESGATDQYVAYRNIDLDNTPAVHRAPLGGSRDYQFAGLEYTAAALTNRLSHDTRAAYELWRGGIKRGEFYSDSTGSRISVDRAAIKPVSKTAVEPSLQGNVTLATALTNNVATPVLSFTAPVNDSVGLLIEYTVSVFFGGANRQGLSGSVKVLATSVGGSSAIATMSAYGLAKTVNNDTISDPVFSVTTSGQNVVLSLLVNSSGATPSLKCTLTVTVASGAPASSIALA